MIALQDYLEQYSSPEPELLIELRRQTYLKTTHPHMISGVLQGRLLSFLSKIIQPKKILEVGTFTGYGTLCLAEGLQPDGYILTIDHDEELHDFSNEFFEKSSYSYQIKSLLGDAKEKLLQLDETFDLIFLDADKENYCTYLDLIKPLMHIHSVLIADNVLWYEKVLDPDQQDEVTQSIRDFNKKVVEDESLEVVMLPIRDGLSLIRKKSNS